MESRGGKLGLFASTAQLRGFESLYWVVFCCIKNPTKINVTQDIYASERMRGPLNNLGNGG